MHCLQIQAYDWNASKNIVGKKIGELGKLQELASQVFLPIKLFP